MALTCASPLVSGKPHIAAFCARLRGLTATPRSSVGHRYRPTPQSVFREPSSCTCYLLCLDLPGAESSAIASTCMYRCCNCHSSLNPPTNCEGNPTSDICLDLRDAGRVYALDFLLGRSRSQDAEHAAQDLHWVRGAIGRHDTCGLRRTSPYAYITAESSSPAPTASALRAPHSTISASTFSPLIVLTADTPPGFVARQRNGRSYPTAVRLPGNCSVRVTTSNHFSRRTTHSS
jgi:hypothetical protein